MVMKNATIDKIYSMVKQSSSFDEALRNGVNYVLKESGAEYTVSWLIDNKTKKLVPYYSICPLDLTGKSYEINEGLLSETITKNKILNMLVYQGNDKQLDDILSGIKITSLFCVPLYVSNKAIGCIIFFNTQNKQLMAEAKVELFFTLKSALDESNFELINYEQNYKKALFNLKDIHKDFINGGIVTNVLKGINLSIFKGEFLVLLGPSGCGKTTLLNIIGGMDNPTDGEIVFNEQDLTNANQKELTNYRKDNIGFVFQSYNLMPNLSAKQNLDLIGELVDNPIDSIEALKLVGLEDKTNNYPSQLSGGQQQRVSIARALVKNPIAIMADEPTAALDYKTSIGVLDVLQNITKEGKTLIMVTHNEEIAKLANRVVRLRDGKVYEISVNRNPAKADELVW